MARNAVPTKTSGKDQVFGWRRRSEIETRSRGFDDSGSGSSEASAESIAARTLSAKEFGEWLVEARGEEFCQMATDSSVRLASPG